LINEPRNISPVQARTWRGTVIRHREVGRRYCGVLARGARIRFFSSNQTYATKPTIQEALVAIQGQAG
jgi:hypothetical protein